LINTNIGIEHRLPKTEGKSKPTEYQKKCSYFVVFTTPETYAQYLADQYGWLDPECYIYYVGGRKVSISSERVKKGTRK
jgi:hypothetical protein